jgi:predicted permease
VGVLTGVSIGLLLARVGAPANRDKRYRQVPLALGKFLFWVGVPISIIGFTRRADLSGNLYLAPMVAWVAILLGLGCSRLWIHWQGLAWPRPTQGSFSLASMLGNTGYIGYPVVLLLPQLGLEMFGWALFYDALGTLLGSYGLGAVLASEFGSSPAGGQAHLWRNRSQQVLRNPIIWAFCFGLLLKLIALPGWLDQTLYRLAWVVVMLSLVLIGMRIQQLSSWQHLPPALVAVSIKMLILPLTVGLGLTLLGVEGATRLVLILQAGMPCAFSNLVLAEAYDLDRDLSVTCVALSSGILLLTLPIWLWQFSY